MSKKPGPEKGIKYASYKGGVSTEFIAKVHREIAQLQRQAKKQKISLYRLVFSRRGRPRS